MKGHSRHYFRRSPEELQKLTKSAFFSFDSSVLLDLYRYPENSRRQFFSILDAHKSKLLLTHQAADEFFSNRLNVISQMRNAHDSAVKVIDSVVSKLKSELVGICASHPYLDSTKIVKYFEGAATKAKNEIKRHASSHPPLTSDGNGDRILKRISGLFRDREGPGFSDAELLQALSEAELRFRHGIPPGFTDRAKEFNAAGDYLIWRQLIQFGIERQAPVFFVTSERKLDWWIDKSGESEVNPKLRKEFYEKTGQEFVLYHSSQFAKLFIPKTKEGSTALKQIADLEKNLPAKEEVAPRTKPFWEEIEAFFANYQKATQFVVTSEFAKQIGQLALLTAKLNRPVTLTEPAWTKALVENLLTPQAGQSERKPNTEQSTKEPEVKSPHGGKSE